MTQFLFATILAERRKELKLTQEDIAQFVGVSRAAVSKWEKGLSYPDITLLPKLAMYFDLSIDTLLGYEPQLTKERIEQLYAQLANRFATEPYEQVFAEVENIITEYYSCYPFLIKMAQLLLNYMPQSPNPVATGDQILALCERVKTNAQGLNTLQESTAIQASVYLMQQKPEQVLALLGEQPHLEFNSESLIASALMQLQKTEEAKQVIQVNAYQKLLVLIGSLSESLLLEVNQPEYTDETVHKAHQLITLFEVEKMNVNAVLLLYLRAALAFTMQQRLERAKEMVEHYLKTCTQIEFPLKLSGGDYFYLLQEWIENEQSLMQQAPRDEQSIKRDLLAAVEQNPLLAPLLQDEQLTMLYKNVQHYLKEA